MLATGFQLAAARALIGMDQVTLAEAAKVSANTIRNMEASKAAPIAGRASNVQAVQKVLEAAGVEFLNHGQPGVRLRKQAGGDHPKPVGPATDAIKRMEADIAEDKAKR